MFIQPLEPTVTDLEYQSPRSWVTGPPARCQQPLGWPTADSTPHTPPPGPPPVSKPRFSHPLQSQNPASHTPGPPWKAPGSSESSGKLPKLRRRGEIGPLKSNKNK